MEELDLQSPNGDGDIDDDDGNDGDNNEDDGEDDKDDESVELPRNNGEPSSIGIGNVAPGNGVDNGGPPSRDHQFVGSGRGGHMGNGTAAHGNDVDNGGPSSRDHPFVGIGRGAAGQVGNRNMILGTGNVVDNGGPPSRDNPFVGSGRDDQVGNGNSRGYPFGGNGGHPSRDNPFIGGERGDPRRSGNGTSHPFGGMQRYSGEQLGHGNGYPFGGADNVGAGQQLQNYNPTTRETTHAIQDCQGIDEEKCQRTHTSCGEDSDLSGVKFITCNQYFKKVMQVILEQEKPDNTLQFVRMYKTTVMGAFNTKRSTCEQSAQEAAMKLLKTKNHVDEVDPPPYSMDTLCKLCQSRTDEEKEAFLWFAGELLECVCGKRAWGTRKKYRATTSDATANDTGKFVVTVLDEAFALLLYDAYIHKWIKRYHEDRRGEPRSKRIVGKYTHTDGASTEYGGWGEEGIHRFNQLCEMVQEDRNSRNAREAEDWVMNSLRQQAGGGAQLGTEREIDQAALQRSLDRTNLPVVNAFIEL